jgi:hypothetical protein
MKRFVMLAALLAAACQPLPAEDGKTDLAQAAPPTAESQASQTPADAAADCSARGGKMLPQGRMQTMQCVVTYSDAGQRCTDGDQCQGECRIEDTGPAPRSGTAAVGQCQPTSSGFGCYTTVEDGKAQATICVD